MAVTSIWRIKGYVGKVILYAMNPEKTIQSEVIETNHNGMSPESVLNDVINYAERDSATDVKKYVSGVNCDASNAVKLMLKAHQKYGKPNSTVAYHGYQSFAKDEVTPDVAHLIGVELANRLWGDKHYVIVTTHLDKESHIHNHFIVCAASFKDGKKYYRSEKDYQQMKDISDELCKKYGLSVVRNPQSHSKKSYTEYTAEKNGEYTKNGMIRRDIDECIKTATNLRQFYDDMKKRGYTFDFSHKYATVYHANFPKARRLKTLGEDYTPEAIKKRVAGNWTRREYVYPEQDDPEELFFDGDRNNGLVFRDYQTVYVHFVCGIAVVKERGDYNRELQRLLGDELIKFDKRVEEQNLLLDNNLYSEDDILSFKDECDYEMNTLVEERKQLRNKLKCAVRADDVPQQNAIKSDVSSVSQRIKELRKKLTVCERILEAEPKIESDLCAVKDYAENIKVKERQQNEHIRRRSRTGRENYS